MIQRDKLLRFQLYHHESLVISIFGWQRYFTKKRLARKSCYNEKKKNEYLPLSSELKKQTDIAEKQCKRLDNTFEPDKINKKEKPTVTKYNSLSFVSKYPISDLFYNELNKFNRLKPHK